MRHRVHIFGGAEVGRVGGAAVECAGGAAVAGQKQASGAYMYSGSRGTDRQIYGAGRRI